MQICTKHYVKRRRLIRHLINTKIYIKIERKCKIAAVQTHCASCETHLKNVRKYIKMYLTVIININI